MSALKQNKGNFEAKSYIPPIDIRELKWWKDIILQIYRQLKSIPEVD